MAEERGPQKRPTQAKYGQPLTEGTDVRTTLPLPFDHYSVAAGRQHWLETGRLVLTSIVCDCRDHPSRLAEDLVHRMCQLAREPGTWAPQATPNGTSAPTLEREAFEEAVALLGTYIRRLEDTARLYAMHLHEEHKGQ